MASPYTHGVKAQLEAVQNTQDGITRLHLMEVAKKHAKALWPTYYVGQGTWIKVRKDLIHDGSLVKIGKKYQLSQRGIRTLATADNYF